MKREMKNVLTAAVVTATTLCAFSVDAIKLGFIGDSGAETSGSNGFFARAVYELMAQEGVELVVQNGDLDYNSDPTEWDNFLQRYAFNKGMQVLVSSGNHEEQENYGSPWYGPNGYKAKMQLRHQQSALLSNACSGSYGERFSCVLGDIHILMIGWLQQGSSGEIAISTRFIHDQFKQSSSRWKFVVWHKPEGKLNNGDAHTSNYGLEPMYEAARKFGAVITSGHCHVYGRTKVINSFMYTPQVSRRDSMTTPTVTCGSTVAFIVGMAGYKVDGSGRYRNANYWAKSVTRDDFDSYQAGALICDVSGTTADCKYKLAGSSTTVDSFTIMNEAVNCSLQGEEDCEDKEGVRYSDGTPALCSELTRYCASYQVVRDRCANTCELCSIESSCFDMVPSGLQYSDGTPAPCHEIQSYCTQNEFVREACPVTCDTCSTTTRAPLYVPRQVQEKTFLEKHAASTQSNTVLYIAIGVAGIVGMFIFVARSRPTSKDNGQDAESVDNQSEDTV